MAIIIPSRHIYEPQSSKINNNFFTEVEVKLTNIEEKIQFDDAVYNYEGSVGKQIVYENDQKSGTYIRASSASLGFQADYAYMDNQIKRYEVEITVPILQENKYIFKLLDLSDEIRYSVSGYKSSGTAIADLSWQGENTRIIGEIITTSTDSSFQNSLDIPKEQIVFTHPNNTIKIYGVENLQPIVSTQKDDNLDAYIIKINIVTGFERTSLSATTARVTDTTGRARGTYETFNGQNISITIGANTIGIDISNKTITINNEGITTANVRTVLVEENELIQKDNGYLSPNGSANEIIYQGVLRRYIGGLETMTIRCPITNYYKSESDYSAIETDEIAITPYYGTQGYNTVSTFMLDASTFSGDDVLSENGEPEAKIPVYLPMTFRLHDIVIPMSYNKWNKTTKKWEDQPRSYTQQGDPKLFEVVGVNYTSGASTWQILTLVEWQYSERTT